MKKVINLIAVLSLIMTIACQNQAKKETQEKKVEVKIERTEEGSKAEITTTKWVEGETIEEIEIIPNQVSDFKVEYHKAFLKKWIEETNQNNTFEEIWEIREQCIEKLSI